MNRRNWITSSLLVSSTAILNPIGIFGAEWPEAQEAAGMVKLSSNENPYGPSLKAREAIKEHIANGNRYPNKARKQLIDLISRKFEVDTTSVMLGAGSSDLLQVLSNWCIREKLTVTTSKLTFDILPKYVKRFSGKVFETDLTEGKGFDLEAIEAIASKNPGVIYLVNPNNPTGSKINFLALIDFCKRMTKHSFVIVDEAYIEYLPKNDSVAHLISSNPKLIVVRTFSKIYGLAGLRIGYLLAKAQLVEKLKSYQVWPGSNLNSLGIAAATASLNDPTFVSESKSKNIENLQYTLKELRRLGRYCVEPHANFIWFKCDPFEGDLADIYAQNNIIIGAGEIDGGTWMRVTIGKKETMQRFIEVAKSIWT